MTISKKYWNSFAAKMNPYTPGFQPEADPQLIKLNTNENPYPPSPAVLQAIQNINSDHCRLYPPAVWDDLRQAISTGYAVPVETVFCGNGSDEILSLILRTFTMPGERMLLVDPSYSLYPVLAAASGVQTVKIPLDTDFQIPFNSLPQSGYSVAFIPNPNAPTGILASPGKLERFIAGFAGIVVIDEAYIDFCDHPDSSSCLSLISKYDNLIVTRTFSKSFSLCGLRAGYAFADPSLIAGLLTVKDSYNLNIITQTAAAAAVNDMLYMKKNAAAVRKTRQTAVKRFQQLGFDAVPSQANFLLVRRSGTDMEDLYNYLMNHSIHVRYFSDLPDYLRVSIGTDLQMERFFAEVEHYLA